MNEDISFGRIIKERRQAHDLTQAELARRVACATITIRKIEADALRPSRQIAEQLALALVIPQTEQTNFVRLARMASLVDRSPPPLPAPKPIPEEIGQADLSGRAIRGYELGERIAVGGFGAIYQALQPYVEREVAVKIILPQYADHPDFIRRFEAEAQLVACLEHPYIVPLYDYWREPGSAYLVMRLMRGGSLQARLKDGPLDLDTTLRLLQQIGNALHSAHRAGIVHRDIKPANILLDEDGNAYLADFGFAKNLGNPNLVEQTQAGTIIGSLEYISPEQIQAEPVKPESDIYCLGIMLYEMLTGQKPFQGKTLVDYIQLHLREPLPPLSAHLPDPGTDRELLAPLESVLIRATAKNPAERYADVIALLADIQDTLSLPAAAAISRHQLLEKDGQSTDAGRQLEVESPYKGLRAFSEADAADFFGRKTLIQTLLGRLAGSDGATTPGAGQELGRFLAVVGPSGSGKSSVVRAGLIPALRQGGLPGSEHWFIVEMVPGTHPWEELEAALLRVAINPPESLLSQLREDERGLLRSVRRILPAEETTELVLVIDQFEEIFTLCTDERSRADLLAGLVMAVLDPRSRLRVIITLRADFTDRPLQYVDFGELVRHRTEFVLALTPDEMDVAITGPARRVGLTLEPGLPEAIVGDLGDQPGTLPLLQYTLTELFGRRVGNALTLGAYQASGGVRGALTSRAEALYADLDDVGQEAVRRLFMRLITVGEVTGDGLSAPDTRRRVLRSELEMLTTREMTEPQMKTDGRRDPIPASVMDAVIDRYGRHRLLTFDRDPVTRGPTLEVAHEALIREWGRLRQWLDEDREFLLWQQRLRAGLHQWQASEQDEGALLRGAPLAEAENWLNQRAADLSEVERNFIQTGLDLREQRAAEREARRQRELEAARKLAEEQARAATIEKQRAQDQARSNQRLRWLAIGLVVFLVGAIGAAFLAVRGTQRAEQQARLTAAREIAGLAINNLNIDPERSILLALQAVGATYAVDGTVTREAEEALHQAVQTSRTLWTLVGHAGPVAEVDLSPDGTRLATASFDGTAKVWDTTTGQELLTLAGHDSTVFDVVFNPDGTRLATGCYDGTAKVWDADTGQELLILSGHSGEINGVAFSPDGTHLATARLDGTANVWDVATGQELFGLTGHVDQVWDINYSPDGTQVATSSADGTARVWDAASGQELMTLTGHTGFVSRVVFSPDGRYLATASQDRTAKVWEVNTGRELLTLTGHKAEVLYVRFSPDGTQIATTSDTGDVKLWRLEYNQGELAGAREWLTLNGHTAVVIGTEFSPDGTRLATGSFDGTARVWDVSPPRELLTLTGHTAEVFGLAFSPDGTRLASAGFDGTARVWQASTGQALFTLSGHSSQVNEVAFSPDGTRLATASADLTAKVWDATTGKELLTLAGHTIGPPGRTYTGITGVAFSPDGSRLATAGDDGTARMWDAATGQELLAMVGIGEEPASNTALAFGGVVDVVFSSDGVYLATAAADGTARVWDATTGESLLTLANDIGMLSDVAISPDGAHLIAASWQTGLAKVWDISTALETGTIPDQALSVLSSDAGTIFGVTYSQDGQGWAMANADGTVKIFEAATDQELLTLPDQSGGIFDVAFSADGTRLATAGKDGHVRLYVLPIEDLVDLARSRVTRSLTTEECQQFLHLDECPTNSF